MRGGHSRSGELFSYVDLESRVRRDHPLRGIREIAHAALEMIEAHGDRPRAITLGADKGYDTKDFVMELREMNVRPHVAQNTSGRRSAIDGRTTRHAGYAMSQRICKRIEEAFGWIKTVACLRKARFRGRARVDLAFTFAAAAYNLVRLPKLLAGASP